MGRTARWGHIRRRQSGRYAAEYQDPTTPHPRARIRAPYTFRTKAAAEAWLAAERALIETGSWQHPTVREAERAEEARRAHDSATLTFGAYAEHWITVRDLTPETRRTYQSYLKNHLLPRWRDTPLAMITTPLVRAWAAQDLAPGYPKLAHKTYALFATIMATAVEDDYLAASPCKRGVAPRRPDDTDSSDALTTRELWALAEAMPDYMQALVLTMGLCALRPGEARELRREDVDLDARELAVLRAVAGQGKNMRVGRTKTRKSVRRIPIPPVLIPALQKHLAIFSGPGPDGLVFPRRINSALHLPLSTLANAIDTAWRRAGIRPATPHMLRHTGLTLAAQEGATLADLQALAGHTTVDMVMRYQHSSTDRQRMLADRISESMTAARDPKAAPPVANVVDLAAARRLRRAH